MGVRALAHEFGEDYKRSRTQSTQQLYEIGPLVSPILQIRSQANLRLSYWAKVMQPIWEVGAIVETGLQVFAYSTLWSSPLRHHLLQEAFQDTQTDSSPSCFCSIACIPVELGLPGNLLPIPTPHWISTSFPLLCLHSPFLSQDRCLACIYPEDVSKTRVLLCHQDPDSLADQRGRTYGLGHGPPPYQARPPRVRIAWLSVTCTAAGMLGNLQKPT